MDSRNRYDVFISYKRKGGAPWAKLLYLALTRVSKKKVFIDWEGIKSGTTETWSNYSANASLPLQTVKNCCGCT